MKNILFGILLVVVLLMLVGCGGTTENLREGDIAPDFTLQDVNGNNYTLSEFRGKVPVVVYFYPKANTSGCTKQACGIRDNIEIFETNNIKVLGISVDSKEALKEFIDDYNLNFPLLSDEDKKVSEAYDVLNNIGLANRTTFIVDKEGKINKIIREVDVNTHADIIFKLASKLK